MRNERMSIAVTGAAGMLGTAILDHLNNIYILHAIDKKQGIIRQNVSWKILDITDNHALSHFIANVKPDIILHCAALVDVDLCERQPALAESIHISSTETIANMLANYGGKLIYISTDSVYDGTKNGLYVEADPVKPLNVYAATKHDGERATLANAGNLVLRTNIFGWSREDKLSFAEWVLKGLVERQRLTMYADVVYTPIHVSHLSAIIDEALRMPLSGLFHAAGSTVITKYDFALQVGKAFGLSCESLIPANIDNSRLGAKRPKNMALDSGRLQSALRRPLPSIGEGLALWKQQYDTGWLSEIKRRPVAKDYRFWES